MGAYKQHDGDHSLPVELSHFDGKHQNGKIYLEWQAESEIRNRGFILDRRKNQTEWITIASYLNNYKLVGKGTTSENSEYNFVDSEISSDNFYEYRLTDVSETNDIKIHNDNIISITIEEETITPEVF